MPSTTLPAAATGLPTPIRSSVGNPPLEKRERSAVAAHCGDRKSNAKSLANDHADSFALDGLNLLGTIRTETTSAKGMPVMVVPPDGFGVSLISPNPASNPAHLDAGKSRVETLSAKSETVADLPDSAVRQTKTQGVVEAHPTLTDLIARERIRSRIDAAVARLIDALDAFDGDPDLEPSMGFYMSHLAPDAEQDAGDEPEVENEHGSDDDNGEPSLGAALNHHDQRHWSQGDRRDVEFLGAEEDVHA